MSGRSPLASNKIGKTSIRFTHHPRSQFRAEAKYQLQNPVRIFYRFNSTYSCHRVTGTTCHTANEVSDPIELYFVENDTLKKNVDSKDVHL